MSIRINIMVALSSLCALAGCVTPTYDDGLRETSYSGMSTFVSVTNESTTVLQGTPGSTGAVRVYPTSSSQPIGRLLPRPNPSSGPADQEPGTDDEAQGCTALYLSVLEAYKDFRYDEVIELAKDLAAHPAATLQQKADAHVLEGAAWYLKGNPDNAEYAFRKAHELKPDAQIDRSMFPDAICRLFNEATNGPAIGPE